MSNTPKMRICKPTGEEMVAVSDYAMIATLYANLEEYSTVRIGVNPTFVLYNNGAEFDGVVKDEKSLISVLTKRARIVQGIIEKRRADQQGKAAT